MTCDTSKPAPMPRAGTVDLMYVDGAHMTVTPIDDGSAVLITTTTGIELRLAPEEVEVILAALGWE